jgi:DNA-binding transcriptional regulator YiaG
MRPFCRLLIKTVRRDTPPWQLNDQPIAKMLVEKRLELGLTRKVVAKQLAASLHTLKNWENGRTRPSSTFWSSIQSLISRRREKARA